MSWNSTDVANGGLDVGDISHGEQRINHRRLSNNKIWKIEKNGQIWHRQARKCRLEITIPNSK